ncbi:hypothetical protein AK88_01535 [Plasmodium fragile]|uniref:Uncharacterized protein n=1 Tax=Plasmodium fragile TaxID=5857 RepID=A0A0D9QP24_PLAFR|nr:uncharacterized protein AK88_01535 [Plasmodium fragile]KJP88845.1 hypothetical protein AK88_01535 [Plasmodium fragile]
MELASKSNQVYLLVKIINLVNVNAVRHVKKALKLIIFDLFGLVMLLKVDFKLINIAQSNGFFVLRTRLRMLNLLLYAMQPSQTMRHQFSLKVLKISTFLPNLACATGVDKWQRSGDTDVIKRMLNLLLYAMQPSQTMRHQFSLKVLKISTFLPNLACATGVDKWQRSGDTDVIKR